MDSQIERDGRFTFSDTSSSIYDYECFDDQSSDSGVWLSGIEFQENQHHWDDEKKQIWHFFNQPYSYKFGSVQRQQMRLQQKVIEAKEGDVFLFRVMKYLLLLCMLATFIYVFNDEEWGILVVPGFLAFLVQLKEIEADREHKEASRKRRRYRKELDILLGQKRAILSEMISTEDILKVFWGRITELESNLYSLHFDETIEQLNRKLDSFYGGVNDELDEDKKIENHPKNPVILSWALLQQSSRSFDDHRQATGVKAARRDIKEKIATFRKMGDGTPLYRLLYLQFLFFRNKNLNVVSLTYDFLTNKQYNVSVDTYQYNHITGTSYSEEDITYMHKAGFLEELDLELPEKLLDKVYGSQVKVISFASTSGSSFRCVLPDKKVTDGLADWLRYKQTSLTLDEVFSDEEVYWNTLDSKTSENMVINKLAEFSVKELWKRCDESTGLSEHKYLEDLNAEREEAKKKARKQGRQPFTGKSQPRPVL